MIDTRVVAGAAAAAVGLCAPAWGQTTGAFFEVSNDLSPSQPSATVTLWIPVPRDLYALAGVRFDALMDDPAGPVGASAWSDPMRLPGLGAPGTNDGTVSPDGLAVLGAVAGQVHFPSAGLFADPSDPIAVWTATVSTTDFTARDLVLTTDIGRIQFYESEFSSTAVDRVIGEARSTVAVVPAPGTGAVLVVAMGLCGVRRRRHAHGLVAPFSVRRVADRDAMAS